MGMAAGQARLLSITSRMSDNELRAQIINNNKMRLATESSQVSESYTTALNQAQMMFTNYDKDNNKSYQQLTFNALTAYNPYNNQYAISNSSGQVLVSERDSTYFKNANGNLNNFLGFYGLENTTTYFDNLEQSSYMSSAGTILYSGGTDLNGATIKVDSGFTAAQLQEKYLGDGTDLHPGYHSILASPDYNDYKSALTNFNDAYDAWTATIAEKMSEYLKNDTTLNFSKTQTDINNGTDETSIFSPLETFISNYKKLALTGDRSVTSFFSGIEEQIKSAKNGTTTYTEGDGSAFEFNFDSQPKTLTFGRSDDGTTIKDGTDGTGVDDRVWTIDANGKVCTWSGVDEKFIDVTSDPNVKYDKAAKTLTVPVYEYDETTNEVTATRLVTYSNIPTDAFDKTTKADAEDAVKKYTITKKAEVSPDSMRTTAIEILNSLQAAIYQIWDPSNSNFTTDNAEYKTYKEKGAALATVLFGTDIDSKLYPKLTDIDWINEQMNNGTVDSKTISENDIDKFQAIYDVVILDNIMNTYGEPKFAWIDKLNKNENADAKAQWYTNLYTRMQSGYKTLQDGLASSSEWMQFAFESGLVNMEQVDTNFKWNTVMYSNCSDITEQTNNAAITKAEAEYKAAMAKIENKDKKYDLELKNIDTEHNSLQTEYDSIKTAIDKNIERTFKMYS